VGKSAREDQRVAERAARVEAVRKAEVRRRRRPFLIGGGLIVIGVVVGLVVEAEAPRNSPRGPKSLLRPITSMSRPMSPTTTLLLPVERTTPSGSTAVSILNRYPTRTRSMTSNMAPSGSPIARTSRRQASRNSSSSSKLTMTATSSTWS
jgi:hypothetical protein